MFNSEDTLSVLRLRAYKRMLKITAVLKNRGITAREIYESSRRELETRPTIPDLRTEQAGE